MPELTTFFIILLIGLIFSDIFKRLHLPYVTALIIAGIAIGPYGLDFARINPVTDFLGSIGVIFLMFIAGSEIKSSVFRDIKDKAFVQSLFNGFIPFIAGAAIGYYFTHDLLSTLILAVIFVSSSAGVIIPSLESFDLVKTRLGETIMASTVVQDIASLLLLALILQSTNPITFIPLYLYIPLLLGIVWLLKTIVPKLYRLYHKGRTKKDLFESELRFVFVNLIAIVVLFEILGLHSIVAGFITGMILTDSIKGKLKQKIHTLSYGLFIPVFFLVIGLQMDISVFYEKSSLLLISAIVFGLIISKIVSGWLGARANKYSNRAGLLMGFASIPQLSTSLAAAFAAHEFGLLSGDIISGLIILSIITTLIAPLLIRLGHHMITPSDLEGNNT